MAKKASSPRAQPPPLGPYLRSLREAQGLTLREVEESGEVSNAYLSQLETGKIATPSPRILHRLASAYGVPYELLMEKAGYISRPAPSGSRDEPAIPGTRIPAAALRDLTPEEEEALLRFLEFLRFQRGRE